MTDTTQIFTADDAAPEDVRGRRILRLLRDDHSVGTAVLDDALPESEAIAAAIEQIESGTTLEKRAAAEVRQKQKLADAKRRREAARTRNSTNGE